MGHRFRLEVSNASEVLLHELLVSLPSFWARSSSYGYRTDGFETKNADAYLFVAKENRIGEKPHPDMEVVIEPYGLYVNSFSYIGEVEEETSKRFGPIQPMP